MAKKKSKTEASPESTAVSTRLTENVTVATAPSINSAVAVEPVAQKTPRSTKKTPKSTEIAPVAEEPIVAAEPAKKQARSAKKA